MKKMGKKLISLFLAVLMLLGCLTTMAAAGGTDSSDTPTQSAKLIVDFNMDTAKSDAVINAADNRAFTVQGGATLVDSQEGHGKALKLDGSTNYINLGTDYQITSGKTTIAAWVKVDAAANDLSRITGRTRTGVEGENDLSLYVRKDGGKLEAEAAGWCASDAGAVSIDTWQHVAVVNDGTSMTLYVNGKAVKTKTGVKAPADSWTTAALLVGAGWDTDGTAPFAQHMFKGLLDDLKIYDGALSADEVTKLAAASAAGGDASLPEAVYEFTMNEVKDGTGTLAGKKVILDTKGNEYPIYGNYKVSDSGIYDQSILFDGSTTYVNVGKPNIEKNYTLEAWTYIDSSSQTKDRLNKIFGRDRTTVAEDALYLCVRGNGNIEYLVTGNKGTTGGTGMETGVDTYKFDKWNHIALTYDGTTYKIYYNGSLVSSKEAGPVDESTNPLDLLIGAGYSADGTGIFSGHAYKGRMDDVRIYNVALTADQIKASTKGIIAKVPPEIDSVDPATSSIPETTVVTLNYNMTIALGTAAPTMIDQDGNAAELTVQTKDLRSTIDGMDSLVIQPKTKLKLGSTYTLTLPAGTVVNANGVANRAASYTFSVTKQNLEGNSDTSKLKYWPVGDNNLTSTVQESDDKVVMTNGLVSRTFDLTKNFLTVSYKNLYTGIEALDQNHLQADVRMTLNKEYHDGDDAGDVQFLVGGVDKNTPTFQLMGYRVEDKTQEIYHWEWNKTISPAYMKDTKWPAAGKALIALFEAPDDCDPAFAGIVVQVRYEIYDGIPVIGKQVTILNQGKTDVVVHHLTSEVLPMPTSLQDAIYMESNMNMENINHDRNNARLYTTKWVSDSKTTGELLSRYTRSCDGDAAQFGPDYRVSANKSFESYRLYDLFYSSSFYEWQMMEVKKMYRTLFPQTTDAPLIYHIISSHSGTVKKGIDEAAKAGFNMVLLSFGSGVNAEDTSSDNIAKYKELCDYAHSKGIMLGAYVMQVARQDYDSDSNDIYDGMWGRMRCMTSQSAKSTLENTLKFIKATGLNCLEIDGVYPGEVCPNKHAGHEGKEDSVTKQWEYAVRDFMKELRALNVYINAPDWDYLCGANMGVMGYNESGFQASRAEQLIYSREMAYYGTFEKEPAMGWTMVPLSPYNGGDSSSYWPYNERIQDYDYIIGVNMLDGVVGSYRGANGLYQAGASENVMETWGAFYNKYRDILNEDIIHIAPPIRTASDSSKTTDLDGIAHESSKTTQRALAAFFNQTGSVVKKTVKIPLYYTGLTDRTTVPQPVEGSHYRSSYVATELVNQPAVPALTPVVATPTSKTAYVCIGDMNGKEYPIDSNGDIEVELTLEPNTYTWLTVYDPANVPASVKNKVTIPAPADLKASNQSSSSVTLSWTAVQMEGRDVKEYHIFRDGKYLGKTFTNSYTDGTLSDNQSYSYQVVAVHNTVPGEPASLAVSTKKDTTAPKIASASADGKQQITVTFDESISSETAEQTGNYAVANNSVTGAKLSKDGKSVVLTLGKALTPYQETEITVNGVKDLAGNPLAADSKIKAVYGYLREFKFNEKDGATAIDSVMGANGTIAGTEIKREKGLDGTALRFDGKSNYVDVGNVVQKLNEYTISGWFKADSLTGTQTLVSQQRDSYDGWKWNLSLVDGALSFTVNNGGGAYPGHEAKNEVLLTLGSGKTKADANLWNQFAVVRSGDTFTLYLNGKAVDTQTKAGIDQSGTVYTTWLGAYRNNAGGEPTACFKGLMDEVRIYNAVRTADQIQDEYKQAGIVHPTEPVTPTQPTTPTKPTTPTEPVQTTDFRDVHTNDWFYDSVKWAVDNQLMNGVGNNLFDPYGSTTRGMIMTILYRQAGSPNATGRGAWYEDARNWAMREKISDGTHVERKITREQLAAMLWRRAGQPKAELSVLNSFTDASKISAYAREAMAWAVEKGILSGKGNGTLDPTGYATRAETAAMFMRLAKLG